MPVAPRGTFRPATWDLQRLYGKPATFNGFLLVVALNHDQKPVARSLVFGFVNA